MTFRYARHTTDLSKIEEFYTDIVGLTKLGYFQNHNNYDGIFLGYENSNWHLEFTVSLEKPKRIFDDDDILVFYLNSEVELKQIKIRLRKNNILLETPKNPYWAENGVMVADPDGCNVIFAIKSPDLTSTDNLTKTALEYGIKTWSELIDFVKHLPYGRNSNREDLSLVIKEGRGTCSSKHALLKTIADHNKVENVRLILGMYRMNHLNTPKIGTVILQAGLDYIPEAHCYIKINNQRVDITNSNSDIEKLTGDIMYEMEINPTQVGTFKVEYHKEYLKNWISENEIELDFDSVWKIREQCIKRLSE